MQLVVDKLAKAFGTHEIFHDVSFMVAKGEKELEKLCCSYRTTFQTIRYCGNQIRS